MSRRIFGGSSVGIANDQVSVPASEPAAKAAVTAVEVAMLQLPVAGSAVAHHAAAWHGELPALLVADDDRRLQEPQPLEVTTAAELEAATLALEQVEKARLLQNLAFLDQNQAAVCFSVTKKCSFPLFCALYNVLQYMRMPTAATDNHYDTHHKQVDRAEATLLQKAARRAAPIGTGRKQRMQPLQPTATAHRSNRWPTCQDK